MNTEIKSLGGGGSTTEITNVVNFLTEETQQSITNVSNYYTEVNQSTGFSDPSLSSISFVDATRTFTIQPAGENPFVFYAFGVRFEKSAAESIQIDDTNGLWYIYYNANGVLGATQTIWDLSTQVPVATILWDNGSGDTGEVPISAKPSKLLNIYIMAVSVAGTLEATQVLLFHIVAGSERVQLSKRLPYSMIKCGTAPTASAVFNILVNGVSKGSATIAAGQTTGTFTWNTKVNLVGGDIVKITGPVIADSTLADVGITLEGIRG